MAFALIYVRLPRGGDASTVTHTTEAIMRKCPRCEKEREDSQFNRTHRWCILCRREYNRAYECHDWKHRAIRTRLDREANVPPITMCYLDTKGGMLCGFDKTEMHFCGTSTTPEDKEDQFFCPECRKNVFVPHCIYPRLRIWAGSPESVLNHAS